MGQSMASQQPRTVTVLTGAGRARLEERLSRALADLERLDAAASGLEDPVEARENRASLEDRIVSLRSILDSAVSPGEVNDDPSIVELGDEVELAYEDGERQRFVLVHPIEIAADADHVSIESPLGRALLGGQVGEHVAIRAPGGAYEVEIVARKRSR